MSQITFAEAEYSIKKKTTRREIFLGKMETLIPWKKLEKILAKRYPKGQLGRPPYPLSTMLRVHAMQLFYNLSDPAMEDALYEIESMRLFAGLRLSENLPDETTILKITDGRRPVYAPKWSTASFTSNACLATGKCATVVLQRI